MNEGPKAVRKKALERYYANPPICKQCGDIINVKEGQKPSEAQSKKFCDHSCSARYSNKDRYDWNEVQAFYDNGNSKHDCVKHFRFKYGAINAAERRGLLRTTRGVELIPLEEMLVENSACDRGSIKARLLKLGILENKCYICGLTKWQGKPIVMRLDHINGMPNDHRLENLRMVCPNCDSQLPTFCGRNKKPASVIQ